MKTFQLKDRETSALSLEEVDLSFRERGNETYSYELIGRFITCVTESTNFHET